MNTIKDYNFSKRNIYDYLYAGSCEQYRYILFAKTLREAKREIKEILHIEKGRQLRRIETPEGYPKSSQHYVYLQKSLFPNRKPRKRKILLMTSENLY